MAYSICSQEEDHRAHRDGVQNSYHTAYYGRRCGVDIAVRFYFWNHYATRNDRRFSLTSCAWPGLGHLRLPCVWWVARAASGQAWHREKDAHGSQVEITLFIGRSRNLMVHATRFAPLTIHFPVRVGRIYEIWARKNLLLLQKSEIAKIKMKYMVAGRDRGRLSA